MRLIEERGGKAVAIRCDITSAASRAALVDEALARFGHVDILVNNAALAQFANIESTTNEQLHHEFEADVFTVSEMTIEPREYPTGRILAFNGTTEWALDSVALEDALWLPHESQLRDMLGGAFRALRRLPDTYEVEIVLAGETRVFEYPDPADAYALALLEVLRRIA